MNITPKLGLRKPEDTDLYDVADFNYNMDILDSASSGRILTETAAKGLSPGTTVSVTAGTETKEE